MINHLYPTWTRSGWVRNPRTGEYHHQEFGVVSKVLSRWMLEIPTANRESPEKATLIRRTRFDAMKAASDLARRSQSK